ncbi:twin-arginine translocase subunit TatC [Pararhodobacter zhoushanensis]|jgi:sec-independent protein translocase protein TatC|uniref:Sec-independent protein translocase protein TatC n=1 Tax=Pararhodobacter zhoushanensis TaxID=2479545 RepID=A0ABT3H3N4_9RHOB|nr:twin-arginine translocase subunit TatC [Pararhodobacter zhoushanensis]MCW1934303.1 twin-arginine translocase subunit TatC [Pararhodobacter zhoushanensis]
MAKSTTPDDIDDSSAPLIEHLAELRNRIIKSLVAFVIAMLLCFMVWNPIFNFLTQPLCDALESQGQACNLVLIQLQEGFFVAVNIAMLGGFVLAFPVIAFQLWRFVAPGLYKTEKNAFLPFLVASPLMFFLGASFAYYVIMPMGYTFFLGFQQFGMDGAGPVTTAPDAIADPQGAIESLQRAGIAFQGSVNEYLSLTTKFIIAFGLCFQLPVLLTLMGKAGLISADALRRGRKWAVVGILTLAAVATPPDVISQIVLFCVVYMLYEISVILVTRVEKKRNAALMAEGLLDPEDLE